MATVLIHAASGTLTGAFTTIYTVPDNRKFVCKAFNIANDTAGAITLDVRVTFASGGTAITIVPARNVANGDTDLVPEMINQILEAGGIIEGQGNGLEFAISGVLDNA